MATLDCGSEISVVSDKVAALGRLLPDSSVSTVEGFDGTVVDVKGIVELVLTTARGDELTVQALWVPRSAEALLLGLDWLRHHEATLDFKAGRLAYTRPGALRRRELPIAYDRVARRVDRVAACRRVYAGTTQKM